MTPFPFCVVTFSKPGRPTVRARTRALRARSAASTLIALTALACLWLAGCSQSPTVAPAASGTAQAVAAATHREPVKETYRTVDGRALEVHIFRPAPRGDRPLPAILSLHGGGWSAGGPEWVYASAQRFAQLGLVSLALQYRLADGTTTPIEALADTCAGLAWVRTNAERLGVDRNRVAAYGVSAGGHLATAAATLGCNTPGGSMGNGGPDALLLWSPAVDVAASGWLQKILLGRATARDLSPVEHMPARVAPASIVQGAADNLTTLDGATRFCELARRNGNRCELNVYPNVGHLLTRNLGDQEDNFDPDPVARADGIARHTAFLRSLWPDAVR